MRIIRIVLAAAMAMMLSLSAMAETKVVEKSAKKAPEWLGTATDGYLVATVEAGSLGDAQRKAINEITERIINAVASNVTVSQTNVASETVRGGNDVESVDSYSRSSSIRSANLPFLSGISLSKAADIYWVKLRDKKTKAEHYQYSVKYPFTRMEQQMLQSEFEEIDGKHAAELQELEEGIDNLTSLDQIGAAVTQLDALADYFFDKPRQSRTKGLKTRYNDLYKSLGVVGGITAPGVAECVVTLQGRPVVCTITPTVTANCANNVQVTPAEGKYRITFDTSDCLEDEDNYIDVAFRIKGKQLKQRIVLKNQNGAGASGKFLVTPCGKINLIADSIDAAEGTIGGLDVTMELDNRGDTDFGVKALHLTVPGVATSLDVEDIDAVYTSRGIVKVKCRISGTLRLKARGTAASAGGTIDVVNPVSGRVERVRFALPYTANWE